MYDFQYVKPASLADAAAKLKGDDEAKLVAGGMTLLPTLKQRLARPTELIDLAGIADLKGIQVSGDGVTIGAMTIHGDVAKSAEVKQAIPGLVQLASLIGDPAVRNFGTIGGSISNNDPAADYPAALVALGATVHTNERQIAAEDFFTGLFETALQPGEIVTKVAFPKAKRSGYAKFRNPASRYAIVGVFVADTANGPRVAVTGAGPCVFRHKDMEAALAKGFTEDAIKDVTTPQAGLNSDIHASAEYRAHLVGVMAKRAIAASA